MHDSGGYSRILLGKSAKKPRVAATGGSRRRRYPIFALFQTLGLPRHADPRYRGYHYKASMGGADALGAHLAGPNIGPSHHSLAAMGVLIDPRSSQPGSGVYPEVRPGPGTRKAASVGRRYATRAPTDPAFARGGPVEAPEGLERALGSAQGGSGRPDRPPGPRFQPPGTPIAPSGTPISASGTPISASGTPISASQDPSWTLVLRSQNGQNPRTGADLGC